MRTRLVKGATVKRPHRTTLGHVALDLCESDTVSPSPLAGSACRVHGCADADTAHKMRHGCDLQGFPVRPLSLAKTPELGSTSAREFLPYRPRRSFHHVVLHPGITSVLGPTLLTATTYLDGLNPSIPDCRTWRGTGQHGRTTPPRHRCCSNPLIKSLMRQVQEVFEEDWHVVGCCHLSRISATGQE